MHMQQNLRTSHVRHHAFLLNPFDLRRCRVLRTTDDAIFASVVEHVC